jgi:peroxiredoxin
MKERKLIMQLTNLPEDLPVPEDDGLSDHLYGTQWPSFGLSATSKQSVNLTQLNGYVVVYVYPMTGRPDVPLPDQWDEIPGARGCTPQSCSFRDHYEELQLLNAHVFGLSVQSSDYQLEAKQRLHLPFELLSDSGLSLKSALKMPTFKVANMELYKRITLIIKDGRITKVFYPVFPSNENSQAVIEWLKVAKSD